MWCPECQQERTQVVGTQSAIVVIRFRRCRQCGYRFMTTERHDFNAKWQVNAEYAREELTRLRVGRKQARLVGKPKP